MWLNLTDPDGTPFSLNLGQVVNFGPAGPDGGTLFTTVLIDHRPLAREDYREVCKKLKTLLEARKP